MSTTRETWFDNGRTYVTSPEPRLSIGALAQAVVRVQTEDETTGQAPSAELRPFTTFRGLSARSAAGGLAGLAGIPTVVFPLLRGQNYEVFFMVSARRFLPFTRNVQFLSNLNFPDVFDRADLGTVALHREPTVITGRIVRVAGLTPTPVPGVTVSLTGFWRIPPPANVVVPPSPPDILSLQPGAYFERIAGTGQVRRRDLTPVPGDSRTLLDDATAGSITVRVSNRTGMAAGQILQIDAADPDLIEFLPVQAVDISSAPDQPALVTLGYGCIRDHRRGAILQRVTASAPGPDNALSADTVTGDASVLTTGLNGLGVAGTVEIHGGPDPEFHLMTPFRTVTDAGGFYRLPLLNRAGQIELAANDGINPPVTEVVVPDYDAVNNRVDFTLP